MSHTRLMILGVFVRKQQPLHGYDVRRELELWDADQWANVTFGSIYFALNKMAEEGLLETTGTEQVGKRPARILYTITAQGQQEFFHLLHHAWLDWEPAMDSFQVALTFVDYLSPEALPHALQTRLAQVRSALVTLELVGQEKIESGAPAHIATLNMSYFRAHLLTTITWIEDLLQQLQSKTMIISHQRMKTPD